MKKDISLLDIIEDIAASVVLADASIKPSIGSLLQLFEEIKELVAEKKLKGLSSPIQKNIDRLYDIIMDVVDDPEDALKKVSDSIPDIQRKIADIEGDSSGQKKKTQAKKTTKAKKSTAKPAKKTSKATTKKKETEQLTDKPNLSGENTVEKQDIYGLLDKLAQDVKDADAEDKVSLGKVLTTLEAIDEKCPLEPKHADRRFISNSIKILNTLIMDEVKNPSAALGKISKAVELIRKSIERANSEKEGKIDFFNMETPLAKREVEVVDEGDINVKSLVEEINSLVGSLAFDNKPGVGKLLDLIEKLGKKIEADELKTTLKKVVDTLGSMIIDALDDPKASLDEAKADIKTITDSFVVETKAEENNEQSDVPSFDSIREGNDGSIILPDWVDKVMFDEFVVHQSLSVDDIESDLLDIENNREGGIDAVKRRIHSLKGEAGVLGLTQLSELCHLMEDFVDSDVPMNDRVDILLKAKDWISNALEAYSQTKFPKESTDEIVELLKQKLKESGSEVKSISSEVVVASSDDEEQESSTTTEDEVIASEEIGEVVPCERDAETVTMMGDFLAESQEGLATADSLLMELENEEFDAEKVNGLFRVFHTIKGVAGFLELKEITRMAHVTETMLNKVRQGTLSMEGIVFDLMFDATETLANMLANVRSAVENGTTIASTPGVEALINKEQQVIDGKPVESTPLPPATPNDRIGEVLQKSGVAKVDIDDALEKQKESNMPLGKQLISDGKAKPKQVAQALRAQKTAGKDVQSAKIRETVKIDLDRIDSLLEMIGELVIVESMVTNDPEIVGLHSLRLKNHLNMLGKITRDLQTVGMQMRMVPVRGVFQKMARMVRDLSRKNEKQIEFIQSGETTEMDRSMVEHISDPLVHMIRNSVDHGIEADPEERTKLGKPAHGTVKLSAYHEGGNIVIEIEDDGKGLDKQAILEKALKQNLIKEKDIENMSDPDIFSLIFAPGFSTAKKVTEISGRGVGMDVVKRNIESMRGRVMINSKPGQGTSFKMILPLTLAIIDGMLVTCGKERYIIPTLSIVESIKPNKEMLSSYASQWELLNVRGEILPLLRLGSLFDLEGSIEKPEDALVVIVECYGKKIGLLVDDVLSQQQVVIKSIGSGINDVKFISGAAIMSNGNVGLIINVEEISGLLAEQSYSSASNE